MIELPEDIRDQLISYSVAGLPDEACGLLAGTNGDGRTVRAERFYAMTNADHSAMTYRLDPTEQLRVFNEIEDKGWELIGIFHSHTHTEAYPSETDRRQAFYPEAHYVLASLADRNNPVVRAFTITEGDVEEHEVRIT